MKNFVALLIFVILLPGFVSADFNSLPEVMVGQTTVTVDDSSYFGGMTGNQAVLNHDPNYLTGFNESRLLRYQSVDINCYLQNLINIDQCYFITPSPNVVDVMISRTAVNGVSGLELATLLYPSKTIVGDAYSQTYDLKKFDFFGRNLYESNDGDSSGSNATWIEQNYTFNPSAQSSFAGEQQDYYLEKIELLRGEADSNDSHYNNLVSHTNWNLENDQFTSPGISKLYPEGKAWNIKFPQGTNTLVLVPGRTYRYSGKGTLVIGGNLRLPKGTQILPDADGDSLGIIVKGKVELLGNNRIQAAMFVKNRFNVNSNNVEVFGSVVAKSFNVGGDKRYGVRFFYDYNLEDNWPPGFRYFKMPHPEEGL